MTLFARSDNSRLSHWWWTVDRWLLVAILLLVLLGVLMTLLAGASVAERLGLPGFHFAVRQAAFATLGVGLLVSVSVFEPRGIRRLALVMFLASVVLIVAALFIGPEIKGARRWLQLGSFTLQPSEFLKPAAIVLSAWLLTEEMKNAEFPGRRIATIMFALILGLLALQPDIGQAVMLGAVGAGQIMIAGLSTTWLVAVIGAGSIAAVVAYATIPHVAQRIDAFFFPGSSDTYQIDSAISAMQAGGFFGRGPGEGTIKRILPDSHTDFVYAVTGEEFGLIVCIVLLAIFAAIVVRGLARLLRAEDPFIVLAAGGLLALFGTQAIVNIGVTLAVIPSTGMTLPFISYGGSSLLSLAVAMGMVLALTRTSPALGRPRRKPRRGR